MSMVALIFDPVVLRVTLKHFVRPVAAFMTSRFLTDSTSRFSSLTLKTEYSDLLSESMSLQPFSWSNSTFQTLDFEELEHFAEWTIFAQLL